MDEFGMIKEAQRRRTRIFWMNLATVIIFAAAIAIGSWSIGYRVGYGEALEDAVETIERVFNEMAEVDDGS